MAELYARLVVKGKKTLEQVPADIRPRVRQILIDWGYPVDGE